MKIIKGIDKYLSTIYNNNNIIDSIKNEQNEVLGIKWTPRILSTWHALDEGILKKLTIFLQQDLPTDIKSVYSSLSNGEPLEQKVRASYVGMYRYWTFYAELYPEIFGATICVKSQKFLS